MIKRSPEEQVKLIDHLAQCASEIMDVVATVLPDAAMHGVRDRRLRRLTRTWHDCHHEMAVMLLAAAFRDLQISADNIRALARKTWSRRDHWILPE